MIQQFRGQIPVGRILLVVCSFVLALAIPAPTSAGGWAVVTLDAQPTDMRPNQPFTVGFVVRQHGVRPMDGLRPIVSATANNGEKVIVEAQAQGAVGHYVATLTLPAGTWTWQIDAFNPVAPMGTLDVQNVAPIPARTSVLQPSATWLLWLVGIVLIVLGSVNAAKQRRVLA